MIVMITRDLEKENILKSVTNHHHHHLIIIIIFVVVIVIVIVMRRDLEREKHVAISGPIREYTRHCVWMQEKKIK